MNYIAGCASDTGIKRTNNQDSFCYELAQYRGQSLAFLVICDGMGGFSKGEVASAEALLAFRQWFQNRLPQILEAGFSQEMLYKEWCSLAESVNLRISEYAASNGFKMGTTLTAVLFLNGQYYGIHVGDCRLYEIQKHQVQQLTHDHTVVQREVDSGILSAADAKHDVRQHILLQCLGAGREITPDFITGTVHQGSAYLLCSDGFRHKFSPEEMLNLNPGNHVTKKKIEKNLLNAIDRIKSRGETDNITAGLLVAT